MESSRAGRLGGAVAAAAGVALLLVLVALASRPDGGGGPRLGDLASQTVLDALFYLLLVSGLLWLLLMIWVLWPRPEDEMPSLPRRRRSIGTMVAIAVAVVLAVWWRSAGVVRPPGPSAGGPGATAPPPGISVPGPAVPLAGVDWPALAIAAAVVLLAAAAAWRLLRSSRPSPSPRTALAGLEALLDDAVEDALREADPRRAVIAAWARLERVLTRHGLPRRASEAPLEYAARGDAELGVGALSLERLADLYEWARFSLNEVTPAMREEALTGLLAVRDGLRRAA